MHITHQPRTFLLIYSNRGIVSRKDWNRVDMSGIVWSVFKWDSGNVVHSLHLEEKCGLPDTLQQSYNDASQIVCFLTWIQGNQANQFKINTRLS